MDGRAHACTGAAGAAAGTGAGARFASPNSAGAPTYTAAMKLQPSAQAVTIALARVPQRGQEHRYQPPVHESERERGPVQG